MKCLTHYGVLSHGCINVGIMNCKYISPCEYKHNGEWKYSYTIVDLGTRLRCVVRFLLRSFNPWKTYPGTHWTGNWVGPRIGLDTKTKLNSVAWVRERTIPTERPPLVGVPTFADRGRHVVSVTDPYGHILGFIDRSRYFFFQAAPQFY
jgi:hypothetical protein